MTTPGQPNPAKPGPTPTPGGPAQPGVPAQPPASAHPAAPVPGSAAPAPRAATPGGPGSPTPPPAPSAPKPARSGGSAAAGAYLLAVVALVIAVAAGAAAAYAIKTAWDVRDANNAAAPQDSTPNPSSTPSEPATATPTATSNGSGTPTPTPTTPAPTGPEFAADFVNAQVNVPAPASSSCNSAYVDVDTLAVGDAAAAGHEFYLSTCGSPLRIFIDRTSGRAISTTADPTPTACNQRVTGTPTSELQIAAETGLTFCLLTNLAQANAQNLPQRLAIVEVDGITAAQVRLVVSVYRIT